MRGNFEYDKGSYPFTSLYAAPGLFYVTNMQTQERACTVQLPGPVADRLANVLNSLKHGGLVRTLARALADIKDTALASLDDVRDQLTATQYQQIKDRLNAL